MTARPSRILAIDPSLRGTGYAVMEVAGNRLLPLTYGVIRNPPDLTLPGCLLAIYETLADLIAKYRPEGCMLEAVIYVQSQRTALTLGAARGAILLAAAKAGLPVEEFAPRRVKQAVVGRGAAQKQQVAFMVRALLGLTETPPPDAADAMAVGIAWFQQSPTQHLARRASDRQAVGRARGRRTMGEWPPAPR